jgi:exodeoxyribonuclease VIII
VTFEQYRKLVAVNWSTLSAFRISALHYHHRLLTPLEPTPTMAFGSAAHVATLEPQAFADRYAKIPDGIDRRTKAGKAAYAAYLEEAGGRDVLTTADWARALAVGGSVRSHPVAGPYLQNGRAEVTLQWTDRATGLECKGRLDWQASPMLFVELKTARRIQPHKFAADAWAYGYFHQAAFYRRGLAASNDCKWGEGSCVMSILNHSTRRTRRSTRYSASSRHAACSIGGQVRTRTNP